MSSLDIGPREAAIQILRKLTDAGYVAYFAGGCVRDQLLGIQPKDYDVATDAKPDEVLRVFPHAQLVGEAFGVCLVRSYGHSIEVATFRQEWGYADGRHPDQVVFTDAQHDALRRDFTINGLFADPLAPPPRERSPQTDVIIDFVKGRADLDAKLVRAVGHADERFAEDYLRMLRAVRFAARLGFEIEQKTARAIRLTAKYLGQISRERIGAEVMAMFAQSPERRTAAVKLMQQLKLDAAVLNEPSIDIEPATFARLDADAAYATALAAWMLDRHLPPTKQGPERLARLLNFIAQQTEAMTQRWRRALCLSNQHRDTLRDVLRLVHQAAEWPDLTMARRKRLLAHQAWQESRRLIEALAIRDLLKPIEKDADALAADGLSPEPLISGQDLIDLGLKPSPDFGRWLDDAYDAQLENRVTTRQQALAYVQMIVDRT